MHNRGQLVIGVFIILIGLLFLLQAAFGISIGRFCWPIGLILLGVFLVLRPSMVPEGTRMTQKLFGDVHRKGSWQVSDEEIWVLIGDVDLDMTQAEFPAGETTLRIYSLIGDVDLTLPADVGVSVTSTAFITDARVLGEKRESFATTIQVASPNQEEAERRLRLETTSFISDVKVNQVGQSE
ncbi:MAG: cell wall-active antibiotics response protein [Chloroflexi bacterium]|jgi:predicted membrane protein|nr:cell wall-active antibiotics response protein [Chloroflexota bacterium]